MCNILSLYRVYEVFKPLRSSLAACSNKTFILRFIDFTRETSFYDPCLDRKLLENCQKSQCPIRREWQITLVGINLMLQWSIKSEVTRVHIWSLHSYCPLSHPEVASLLTTSSICTKRESRSNLIHTFRAPEVLIIFWAHCPFYFSSLTHRC